MKPAGLVIGPSMAAAAPPMRTADAHPLSRLLRVVLVLGLAAAGAAGCTPQSHGPLVGGTADATTTGITVNVGQVVTWGDTTLLVNPTHFAITLKSVRLLPAGDASGAVEDTAATTILPAGNGPDFSAPGIVVGTKSRWFGRSVRRVTGYRLPPTAANHDGDSILFVVRAVRKGKWAYRGFEVSYTAAGSDYTADYTKNALLICVAVDCGD